MKCSRPFTNGVEEFGCRKCPPCLMNRRRLWTGRIMLEARKHDFSAFITLTYNKESINERGELCPKDLQLFLKKFRKLHRVRFFACGEYGERRGRPHYHLALFGLPTGALDEIAKLVDAAWGKGDVHVGSLTAASAAYVASYVTKGWTKRGVPELMGRHPEFVRMSLKPGIGATAVDSMGKAILEGVDLDTGELYGLPDGDVPSNFRLNGAVLPLGRYLRQRLRLAVNLPKEEPKATGELRRFRRQQDLRAAGLRGWKVREDRRQQSEWNARGFLQRSSDRKGIWL